MRESRTYGSVRGARDEIRVPTATLLHGGGHPHMKRGGPTSHLDNILIENQIVATNL